MKKLSVDAVKEYLKNDGYYCPYCGSSDILSQNQDGEHVYQVVECYDCGKTWKNIWQLVGIEDAKGFSIVP